MSRTSRALAHATMGALCVSSIAAVAAPQSPPYALQNPTRLEKSCTYERYTLEVPVDGAAFPSTFATAFASAVALDRTWFGLPSLWQVRAKLTPVLADYAAPRPDVPVERRDGHRRAYVVTFERHNLLTLGSSWSATAPLSTSACLLVTELRRAAAVAKGVPTPKGPSATAPVLVSRSCDGVAQDAEGWALPSTVEWAETRVKAPHLAGLTPVDVALVDTGVPSSMRAALGVKPGEWPLPGFENSSVATYHPHGAQMAAMIHAVAPNADITSWRALDDRGMGSLLALARATDDALFKTFSNTARRPLVVNLSVGAPPDVALPTTLRQGTCSTWEDGSGETMRYVLRVAGLLDATGPAVFVSAASGNLPLERAATAAAGWAKPPLSTACGAPRATMNGSFFPASTGEFPTCMGAMQTWPPVAPVGASDWSDGVSSVSLHAAQLQLYAPGERVFAHNTLLPATSTSIVCDGSEPNAAFELPAAVTGTSASAAFVSGAAAQVLGLTWAPVAASPRARHVGRTLHLTGDAMCGAPGPKPRRLNIDRAMRLVSSRSVACNAFLACVGSAGGPVISAAARASCESLADACVQETPPCVNVTTKEPGWESGQWAAAVAAPALCRRGWDATPRPWQTPAPGSPESTYTDMQLAGLGPQPSGSICTYCSVLVNPSEAVLLYELNDALPRDARVRNAYISILDRDKVPLAWLPVSDGLDWWPGQVGKLKVPVLDVPGAPEWQPLMEGLLSGEYRAVLDVVVVPPRGEPSRSLSPLRVDDY